MATEYSSSANSVNHQIDYLTQTLRDANQLMHCNEELLSNCYRRSEELPRAKCHNSHQDEPAAFDDMQSVNAKLQAIENDVTEIKDYMKKETGVCELAKMIKDTDLEKKYYRGSSKRLHHHEPQNSGLLNQLECELNKTIENLTPDTLKKGKERTDQQVTEMERLSLENSMLHQKVHKLIKANQNLKKDIIKANEEIKHWKREVDALSTSLKLAVAELKQNEDTIENLKLKLLDEKSLLEITRQNNHQVIADQWQLGIDLNKSLEDSEKLKRKYSRAKKHFEDKAVILEDKITQTHMQEMEMLRHQLQDKERVYARRIQEQENTLQSLSREIDSLISILVGQNGAESHFPFSGTKCAPSVLLAKARWIWKELNALKQLERTHRDNNK